MFNVNYTNKFFIIIFSSEYGRLAAHDWRLKPFQKLLFLVRDWQFSQDAGFGFEGGRQLLNRVMNVQDVQEEQFILLRKHIESSFGSLECFLLPYPGQTVAEDPNFSGSPEQIDARFMKYLTELTDNMLSPENLKPKVIGGREVRCGEMLDYFIKYMHIFSGDTLPQPKSIFETTAQLVYLHALNDAKELYAQILDEMLPKDRELPVTDEQLKKVHTNASTKSVLAFKDSAKFGDMEKRNQVEKTLISDIKKIFGSVKNLNDSKILNLYHKAKDSYEISFDTRFSGRGPLHIHQLDQLHREASRSSSSIFKTPKGVYFSTALSAKLEKYFALRFEEYKSLNFARIQLKTSKLQEDFLLEYGRVMESVLEGPFSVTPLKLDLAHENTKREILEKFSKKEDYGSNIIAEQGSEMEKTLDQKIQIFRQMNAEKSLQNRVKRTLRQLGDNETYKVVWRSERKKEILATSIITIIVFKSYYGA